ncbi:MAG: NAD-dependent epimerase/dehydratase family protein [Chloroflexi bacterium]|nr:NAD-dependent epimerase/dehydratase family protein [Chloroflexota bacterium]
MVIIVTGGAGFVGSNLIKQLLKRYPTAQIVSIDNYFIGSEQNHVDDSRVNYHKGNTMDINEIWAEMAYERVDALFHLGEYSRIVQSFADIDLVWEFNMRGTKEVVKFCGQHNCRLLYAGSSSKFGNEGADENLSPYAWIKAKNIEYIKNFSQWFGLDYVITYFYNVYGKGHLKVGHYASVIGIFETQYAKGEPLTVVAPGTQSRDFTHVEDIVAGIITVFEKGKGDGYCLGTGQPQQIVDLARMFTDNYVLIPERQGERCAGQADNAKVRALGWEPTHSLADYIQSFKESVV